MTHALEIAQNLIRFPSVTPDETKAQDYVSDLLRTLGFEIYSLPFEGRGSYPVRNLFARKGNNGPHLCFLGHTDVVPAGDERHWSAPPFSGEVKGNRLIGRGASDMKGNIAAFIAALESFIKDCPDAGGSISLLITGDEEKDAVNGTARVFEWMKDNGHIPNVCLVGEPSNPDFMGQEIKIGRRGSLSALLTVTGKQGHVAYPERADNPLPRLITALDLLAKARFDEGTDHFPPTNLEITSVDVGNTAGNVIPAQGSARFNVRFSDLWTCETLEKEIIQRISPAVGAHTLHFTRGAESFLTTPGPWTELVSLAVETVTGRKPVPSTSGGTSDARFAALYAPVVECGMVNKTIHQVDECCTREELEICVSIYREILKLYFA